VTKTETTAEPEVLRRLRDAQRREAKHRREAEEALDALRASTAELAWQAALWRAGVRRNPGSELIGPRLDPGIYDDPDLVRVEVGRLTAELIGAHVESTGRSLTEIVEDRDLYRATIEKDMMT
jgi:hypothetical protein